jgi:hypothetical protein
MYPSLKNFLVAASLVAAALLLPSCASLDSGHQFPEPPISPLWHRS